SHSTYSCCQPVRIIAVARLDVTGLRPPPLRISPEFAKAARRTMEQCIQPRRIPGARILENVPIDRIGPSSTKADIGGGISPGANRNRWDTPSATHDNVAHAAPSTSSSRRAADRVTPV